MTPDKDTADAENISMLTEETKIQGVFICAFDRLDALNRLRLAGANAEIDELKAGIKLLEADTAAVSESDQMEGVRRGISEFALRKIAVELHALASAVVGGPLQSGLERIRKIATTVLEREPASMSEGETDAHRLEKLTAHTITRLRNALMQIQTQSLALCKEWVGQCRVDIDSIHAIATEALNYREAHPKEKTDDD